jgi:hypothetical protein
MPRPTPRNFARSALAAGLIGATTGLVLMAPLAQAQVLADPRVAWHTADSAHFRVHYRESQRAQAEAVALAAERIYPRVTQGLAWEPRGRTEIVLYSEFDIPNGFTTPLPFNKIGVFLAPPDAGAACWTTAPGWTCCWCTSSPTPCTWTRCAGAPACCRPSSAVCPGSCPTSFSRAGPPRASPPQRERPRQRAAAACVARLRGLAACRAGAGFLSLREINADGRALPLSKQYLYGAYFYDFLARRYGADKPAAVIQQYSGNIVPRLHSAPLAPPARRWTCCGTSSWPTWRSRWTSAPRHCASSPRCWARACWGRCSTSQRGQPARWRPAGGAGRRPGRHATRARLRADGTRTLAT